MTFRLGILISGGGTTFLNLHERIKAGQLQAEIACVVSSKSKAAGLDRAREFGYPSYFVGRRKHPSDEAFSEAITKIMEDRQVDLIILAGFLRKYIPSERYNQRCLNIHPALIPAFCGLGFYGMKVHEAVWRKSCKVSGCTVHLVNAHYDDGPIIVQKTVALDHNDTPEDIQRKVFKEECEAYPEAIAYFIENRITFQNGRSIIAPKS